MALTTAQLQALKAAINADGALAALPHNDDAAFTIAAAFNALASPAFIVWRTNIPTKDVRKVVVWTEMNGIAQVPLMNWYSGILANGIVDASDANVRQGIADIFAGPGAAATRTALVAMAKRSATRAEKLFATGTGSDGSPAVMVFEGNLSYQDVVSAWNS
jgi:hypothetical protein